MPKQTNPETIKDCFALYLKYNGERLDLIEREMNDLGWAGFRKEILFNRGIGKNFREGWIQRFGWQKSLELKIATAGVAAQTSAESLLFEVESIRKKVFMEMQATGVTNRDLVYQHDKYVQRTTDILASLEKARDNYGNFVFFLQHLLKAASAISPGLAKEICDAEDALLDWAEKEFVTDDDAPSD